MNHIQIAVLELGNAEEPKGSNAGPHVEKYLKSVGLKGGFAWCMAFVHWCVEQSGPKNVLVHTAGVMDQWHRINPKYKVTTPQPGDIFIMDFGGGKGHTGFVEDVKGDRIMTIEGNSNDEGSREGYEVCRKPGGRKISSCIGFIRITQ